tara:strand:+ start:283 stop:486 length:204 start_codon:yes stop_codon:yes gene_type:complete
MDEMSYEEIISILAKCGRPDLIASFKELIGDPDYVQSSEEESSSDDDPCVMEELEVVVDNKGFMKLL